MRKNQRGYNLYDNFTGNRGYRGGSANQQLVTVNEDGVPLYQHSFGTLAVQAQQNTGQFTQNIPQSRERRHNRVLSAFTHHMSSDSSAKPVLLTTHHTDAHHLPDSDQDIPVSPSRHHEHPGKVHDTLGKQHTPDNHPCNVSFETGNSRLEQRICFEDELRDSITSLAYDNRVLNKLLDKLTENKKEIMSAYSHISSLEEQCTLKDDHIKSLRQHIAQIEQAKQYAEKTIYEYNLKLGDKFEKSIGDSRPSTKDVKLQTRLQSHVLSTILDRANVDVKYNIADFVQEENEDSDETRILVGTDQRDLCEEESQLNHIVDIVVSRYKTIEQEILKEEDFIPLCQICSHTILKNQLSKQLKQPDDLSHSTSESQEPNGSSTSDNLYHKERTMDEQIDDNIRLGTLLNKDFQADIESIKTETINNLSAEYALQMAVFLPNTHNLLINGLEMVCQHRSGLYAINFTNPYIRSTFQGNFNSVHDAQVPKAFSNRAEELRTTLIMNMQNELILRQRHRFNTLLSQKIPKVLFSHNTKDANILRVEATREHYLKYFRNYREYREITPADMLYEATRGHISRYYENCTDIQQSSKDQQPMPTGKRCGSAVTTSSGTYSAVYMGHGHGPSPGLSENDAFHTQVQLDLPNSIYEISDTLSTTSAHKHDSILKPEPVPLSMIIIEDQPTNTYSISLPSTTHIGTSISSPSDIQRTTHQASEKVKLNDNDSVVLNTTPEAPQTLNVRYPPRIIPSTAPKATIEHLSALEALALTNATENSLLERSNTRERPYAKALLPGIGQKSLGDEHNGQFLAMPMQHLPDISELRSSADREQDPEVSNKEPSVQRLTALEVSAALPISEASPLQQYRNKIQDLVQAFPSISDISAISEMTKHSDE
ncbi:Hypothetical protein GLP15_2308 [Giardia lamblia P15]|uniref:Uncharacterized protein n=1 Tax=Giardia intestinalis (strain P15) TaxID=658858 RepID=E1F163_GIAIA|nr:Hypothetical protein GLP15_2308 [Giardia lamblia P15]